MKKSLLFILLFASFISIEAMGQCGRVSLIGEFNGWADDHFMTRNPETPELFTTILVLTAASDPNADGIVEMKFRANSDWATNWGSTEFPSGTATPDGPNVPVPVGSYKVDFNCATGAYTFTATCGEIGLIGEFTGWAADEWMHRSATNPDEWSHALVLTAASDPNADGIVEMKFRANSDWATNWGSTEFPSGTGTVDGPNIPVPVGSYIVTFNCATGAYNFLSTCGNIALIGEFNGWAEDFWMMRDMNSPDNWSAVLSLNAASDPNADGIVEMKFRMNSDWGSNWGAAEFPAGIGVGNGPNIPVPMDGLPGLTTDYLVTFNCATGAYNFTAASGMISMIGAFNGWNGDIPMNRDMANPNLWHLSRSWYADFEVKFRENKDWTVNWGNNTFPTGTGTDNGPNIPLTAGKYDVTFNTTTLAYNFVVNNSICGEIGLIGDFNNFGVPATGDVPTDIWMVRDPMYPSQFTANVNFTSSTRLWFRLDADPLYEAVWGGTFPEGTGVYGGAAPYIDVPGGKYDITFNCKSGDFKFFRLGNGVTAPKVFTMVPDGFLNEADWQINQNISQIVMGTPGDDLNEVSFGVTYNDEFLFIGLQVKDATLTTFEMGEVFIDGNKNGGAYDENDLHLRFAGPYAEIIQGDPTLVITPGFQLTADGYTAEIAIPWSGLGLEAPVEGGQIGFDIMVGDGDSGTQIDYFMAWNGGMQNYAGTSSFGDLLFGTLSCGCISLFNDAIGDMVLQNPTGMPTTYVGTYELFENQSLVFRKDMDPTVKWANDVFPAGTAVLDGSPIPGTPGRYRITFNCLTGEYNFETDATPAAGIALSEYIDTPPAIDGNLTEYNLSYGSEVMAAGANNNNTVTWGSRWDGSSLYLGVKVVDAVIEGSGNPWDNDAVEYYIDGNHDSDGTYDGDFDTQLIQDFLANSLVDTSLWVKADGVPVTNFSAKWLTTDDGYNVELRLGWDNFGFYPGKGRSIGFSLGNNDSDNGIGRDYQTVWYGTGSNWSNTADLGDLQLAGGPYYIGINEIVDYSSFVVLFPNPANANVYLRLSENVFNGQVTVMVTDISGRTIQNNRVNFSGASDQVLLNVDQYTPGIYFVNILGNDGTRAVKKLIVR